MTIYIVPKNELSRFASSLGKPISKDLCSPNKDEVIYIKHLTESFLQEVLIYIGVWHVSRDLVTNSYSGDLISNVKIKYFLGTEYINYWCAEYNIQAYPSVIKRLSFQCDFIGYDDFFQFIMRYKYLSMDDKSKYMFSSSFSFSTLFKAIASADIQKMLNAYFKLTKNYGVSRTQSAILTFMERIISYFESKSSIASFSEEFKNLIKLAERNIPPNSIITALYYLSNKFLPFELRILLFFKGIGDKSFSCLDDYNFK